MVGADAEEKADEEMREEKPVINPSYKIKKNKKSKLRKTIVF